MALATQLKLNTIMATQAEIVQALKDANTALTEIATEVDKVGTETDGLITKIAALQATIDAGGTIGPELVSAMADVTASAAALKTKVVAVDDKVTDAAPPA
jgi:uncharacterized protein YoxC